MKFFLSLAGVAAGIAVLFGGNFLFTAKNEAIDFMNGHAINRQPSREERIRDALKRSENIKGLYMTADIAGDQGAPATRLRNEIIRLVDTTEVNGIVIDIKEVCGPDYKETHLKKLVEELRQKNIWTIARIVAFKDASQIEAHPEWYLKRAAPKFLGDQCTHKKHLRPKPDTLQVPSFKFQAPFWQDKKGGYWLDPASDEARKYIADFSKDIIDLGFDELQFDYIRFPSDGDVENAIYPVWDGTLPKFSVMKSFFEFLNRELKAHKPEIILSADLFAYIAIQAGDAGVGQRLEDLGNNFDYVSFMVYPSHYYHGLSLPENAAKNLPKVSFTPHETRAHPDIVIERTLQIARDFFDGVSAASAATTASAAAGKKSDVRLRPWLEDFFHEEDKAAGRPWGAEKVRLEIDAAERVERHGWMLWNAANIYTEEALKKE